LEIFKKMLVLAMEFSRGTAARGRRSLTAEQEQLGRVLDRLWDSLEQALGFYHDRAERSRLASDRLECSASGEPGPTVTP